MINYSLVMLNPQPLPPGPPPPDSIRSFSHVSWVMLNPQPLPPMPVSFYSLGAR